MTYNPKEKEIRCEQCARTPLLATFGVDKRGRVYIHIKVWKQSRVFAEIIVEGGSVLLNCRECRRWCRVIIRNRRATVIEEPTPDSLADT